MTENQTELLDETLDDLADAPRQAPYPAGAYLVSLRVNRNENKAGCYIINMTCKEVIELANPNTDEADIPVQGDQSAVFIYTRKKDGTANEIGQGQLKLILQPIAAMLGTNSISEILKGTHNGVDCIVVVKVKEDKTGQYQDSQIISKLDLPA